MRGFLSMVVMLGVVMLALVARHALAGEGRVAPNPLVGTLPGQVGHGTPLVAGPDHQLAIFAEGCFWGSEERFRRVPGVVATAVGYTGGDTRDPTYEDVCGDMTGHAESVLVEFDPARVTYADLLKIFWASHDPTTPDAQGPDHGTQYRSAIFALDPDQLSQARDSRDQQQRLLTEPITTEIAMAGPFWMAETYHRSGMRSTASTPVQFPATRGGRPRAISTPTRIDAPARALTPLAFGGYGRLVTRGG